MGDANPDDTLRAAFQVFDANGDGTISADEIKAVMREMGEQVTDEDMSLVLGDMDENGDGMIDYHEFSKAVTSEIQQSGYNLGL
jgi:calmodulin